MYCVIIRVQWYYQCDRAIIIDVDCGVIIIDVDCGVIIIDVDCGVEVRTISLARDSNKPISFHY